MLLVFLHRCKRRVIWNTESWIYASLSNWWGMTERNWVMGPWASIHIMNQTVSEWCCQWNVQAVSETAKQSVKPRSNKWNGEAVSLTAKQSVKQQSSQWNGQAVSETAKQ